MGMIVPFPRSRHRSFVQKHAANIARMGSAAGERYLAQQLEFQREVMRKRGIEPKLAEPQLKALEAAIRAALWRVVLTPGGAA